MKSVPEPTEAQDDRAFREYLGEDPDRDRREREEAAIDAKIERDRDDSQRLFEYTKQVNSVILTELRKGR